MEFKNMYKMSKIKLFHGTAHDFAEFDDRFIFRSHDANSAMGIHLTEDPAIAAEYARTSSKDAHAGTPKVLVVEAEVRQIGVVSDPADYLGRDPDFEDRDNDVTRVEFIERRFKLMDQGFCGICMDENYREDLTGAWIIFCADRLKIIDTLTPEEAETLAEDYEREIQPDIQFESVTLFADRNLKTINP